MKEPSLYLTKHQVDLLYELVDLGYSFQNARCFVLEIEEEERGDNENRTREKIDI